MTSTFRAAFSSSSSSFPSLVRRRTGAPTLSLSLRRCPVLSRKPKRLHKKRGKAEVNTKMKKKNWTAFFLFLIFRRRKTLSFPLILKNPPRGLCDFLGERDDSPAREGVELKIKKKGQEEEGKELEIEFSTTSCRRRRSRTARPRRPRPAAPGRRPRGRDATSPSRSRWRYCCGRGGRQRTDRQIAVASRRTQRRSGAGSPPGSVRAIKVCRDANR